MAFRSGLRVGKLLGIEIVLDWSLIVIFLLVTFSLGSGVLPAWHPDWSAPLVWGVAIAAAVLFFVSILLHELSHALVAKHYGIPVSSITLFLFGGVANIEHDPDSPKKEALMAAVGPLTSLALGVIFIVLAGMLMRREIGDASDPATLVSGMGPVTTLLAWLGPVNIVLGLFNLLPGFPLDGGRVLRATLWGISKDLREATRRASLVGRFFGWTLIAIGFAMIVGFHFPLLGGGLFNGMWLAFIGWFLSNAAAASYRALVIRETLGGVRVAELMRRGLPTTVESSMPIRSLVDAWARRSDEPLIAVSDDAGAIAGFVRPGDVRRVPRSDWDRRTAGELAGLSGPPPTVHPDDTVFAALGRGQREAPEAELVVADGEIVGVLRRDDVMRWLSLQADTEAGAGLPRDAATRV
jgi:Zn-dependent protease